MDTGAHFGSTSTKIGTVHRFAWLLCKDDMHIRETFYIFGCQLDGDHFTVYTNVKSPCVVAETHVMLCVNYTLILKK